MALSTLARSFINRYQGGFPLHEQRPFAVMGKQLGVSESILISLIEELNEQGLLSRFGPIYNASLLGGGQTLAALQVPEQRFSEVADIVNAYPEVAHNYRRDNRLNMWFVLATADAAGISATLREIERETGLTVYDFPKQQEFYLGLWLVVDQSGALGTAPVPGHTAGYIAPHPLDASDLAIISATQSGLPLVSDPLKEVAGLIGLERAAVVSRMQRMLEEGAIRRIGAIPNHYRLGLRGNGMTVWDIPDEIAAELGEQVGALDFVSHAYLRPRHPGVWRYNLFAMVHGRERDEVQGKVAQVESLLQPHCRAHQVLFSSEVLKKTGLRLVA